jgi:serine protease Do
MNLKVIQFWLIIILLAVGFGCETDSQQSGENDPSIDFTAAAAAQTDSEQVSKNTAELYSQRQNAITIAVAKASPAMVGINVTGIQRVVQRNPFNEDPFWRSLFPELFRDRVYEQQIKSLGSGFIISPAGYIVTNEHVVENATEIVITVTDGKHYKAEIVGSDRLTDIALLKVKGENIPYLELGNSDHLIVGEWAIALGNPFGLFELNDKPTVTVGVISAVDRDWGRTQTGRLYMDMIQTDAAINHGNSGGPLVNSMGQVIGMNTFIFTGSNYQQGFIGIGFAIPINRIKAIVNEIREEGSINRGYWLGILDGQDLNPYIIRALGLSVEKGVIITRIERDSPAYKAGIREEDVIIQINDNKINSRNEFISALTTMDLKVGSIINFTVVRINRKLNFKVKLETQPE